MSELEIIFYNDFWYFINDDDLVFEMKSLPLRTKLLNKFFNDIEEIYKIKKNNNTIKLIFQKDNENFWTLNTIYD